MNHNHQFTGGYDFLLAGEPPYRQLVCCMVSVLSSALATGTVIMGASLILAYFATFWNEAAIDYIIFPAITIGLAFILYGQIKYNHGIF